MATVPEQICRRVFATDLQERPLYVITAAELGINAGKFHGLHCAGLAHLARPALESSGRWEGAGPVVLVERQACESAEVALALHEVCHWLDFPERAGDYSLLTRDDMADVLNRAVGNLAAIYEAPIADVPPAIYLHDDTFTRLACHAWWRAVYGCGYYLRPEQLHFAGVYHGLDAISHPSEYVGTLYRECQSWRGRPLRELASTPPPAEFTDLWNDDLRRLMHIAEAITPAA